MKKLTLFLAFLFTMASFTACEANITSDDETIIEKVDPADDGTIKGEDEDDDGEG